MAKMGRFKVHNLVRRQSYPKQKRFEQGSGQTKMSEFKRSDTSRYKRNRGSFYRKFMGNKHYKKRHYY